MEDTTGWAPGRDDERAADGDTLDDIRINLSDADWKALFRHVLALGWELPIRFAVLGTNGAVVAGQLDQNEHGTKIVPRFTVAHAPGRTVEGPLNILCTSATGGQAVRARVSRGGVSYDEK